MQQLTLFTYCKSSAAYRIRIALNLKKLNYQSEYISLINNGGEEKSEHYSSINPQQLIPSLTTEDGIITQSLAIMEYIEDKFPSPKILPDKLIDKAFVRSLAQMICCDIHPLNNLRVIKLLENDLNIDKDKREKWYQHWIDIGFAAIEKRLINASNNKKYCVGETPTIADACLIPQVYNANRFNCEPEKFSTIYNIYLNCMSIEAFDNASPERQADFLG